MTMSPSQSRRPRGRKSRASQSRTGRIAKSQALPPVASRQHRSVGRAAKQSHAIAFRNTSEDSDSDSEYISDRHARGSDLSDGSDGSDGSPGPPDSFDNDDEELDDQESDGSETETFDYAKSIGVAAGLDNEESGPELDSDDELTDLDQDLAQEALLDGLMASGDRILVHDDEDTLYDGNTKPVEEWRQILDTLDEDVFARKDYSPGTESLIRMCERFWLSFNVKILCKNDPRTFYQGVTFKVIYCFLDWMLSQKKTDDGRSRRGVTKRSSLVTFWCAFRLAFERMAKKKIDRVIDCHKMSNAISTLCRVHHLSHEKRDNRVMTLEDLKLQLDTTLRTTEKTFKLGEQRILAVLFLQLLAPAGSRPASILKLRFGDLELALRRDPKNPTHGPYRLIIRMTLQFTKRYLGPKAAKTFHIPEIIYEPTFLLNTHAFLLGILFRYRAFRAEGLNDNPQMLDKISIPQDEPELRLPLKDELRNMPVFRRAAQNLHGFVMTDKPILLTTMCSWVKRIGEIVGFERNTICYSLRYMAGNSLDQDDNVSEALRNLILDHAPGSDTFQKHYLSRNVCVDLWAVHSGNQPQHLLVQQSVSHGSSRSMRRPLYLTNEQSDSIKTHPTIVDLERQLRSIPQRTAMYQKARLELNAKKRRMLRDLQRNFKEAWTENQAVEDVERQIQGLPVSTAPELRNTRPLNTHQKSLIDALTTSLICDLPTQRRRRVEAINAIVAYCQVEEPVPKKVAKPARKPVVELQQPDAMEQLRQSVIVKTEGERLDRCFICVGKAIRLPPGDAKVEDLCRAFSGLREAVRHFRSQHLSNVGPNDTSKCPICRPEVVLRHRNHLQRHAEDIHGIKTSPRGWH